MEFRAAIEQDADDLRQLAGRAGLSEDWTDLLSRGWRRVEDWTARERRLDAAALALRRAWLDRAHEPADATLKSPREGQVARLAGGPDISFGYERDLDVSMLERRQGDLAIGMGRKHDLVLFRSGQAALACLIQFAVQRWGERHALTVAHTGAYFETAALLAAWPDRIVQTVCGEEAPDVAIVEPVWCDGQFGFAGRLPAARHLLIVDTTMAGPACDLAPYMPKDGQLTIAYRSGLKLDQAGLELANVGIARLFGDGAPQAAAALRELRGLTGTGLTLDEASALSVPWFMDLPYAERYTGAIFANNRALAQAVGRDSPVFEARCHPSLTDPLANAPFCAFVLNEPSPERYRALERRVAAECERRGLLASKGGSFGFRGHRFELIEPDRGKTFLRVALGWRDGWSREGLCALFAELAYGR